METHLRRFFAGRGKGVVWCLRVRGWCVVGSLDLLVQPKRGVPCGRRGVLEKLTKGYTTV